MARKGRQFNNTLGGFRPVRFSPETLANPALFHKCPVPQRPGTLFCLQECPNTGPPRRSYNQAAPINQALRMPLQASHGDPKASGFRPSKWSVGSNPAGVDQRRPRGQRCLVVNTGKAKAVQDRRGGESHLVLSTNRGRTSTVVSTVLANVMGRLDLPGC